MGVETMILDKLLVGMAAVALVNFFVADATAQRPEASPSTGQKSPRPGVETPTLRADKTVEGQGQSVNASGTEITLTDGTTLATPPGAAIRPGVIQGFRVVASYQEENGKKVLTHIALKEPADSPRTTPRSPAPTTPPRESTPRY